MFTTEERHWLADLARQAADNPQDMRALDVAKMDALAITIGNLRIAFSYDRMPPDWHCYRHLSVSDSGQPPSEAVFMSIASELGMNEVATWNTDLARLIERLPIRLRARHAFQSVT